MNILKQNQLHKVNRMKNIAEVFNKKHTTIMFAYEKVKKEILTNKEITTALREIKQGLKLLQSLD